jgi:DNA repair protein RecN (Recombination protein N)
MLLSLRIENFALVDRLDLDLSAGLTVLTGETGAGKSIILDAIDAVLGGKVNGRAVRTGADRAQIDATFALPPDLQPWLTTQGIEPSPAGLVCSREITTHAGSQRSRSRINGTSVNKQQMEQLRDRLVEITAQGQTVQLGQPGLQRDWLDSYGGEPLLAQRATVATAFAAFQQANQALEKRRRAEQERLQQLDLFDYQLRELNAANLEDPEELAQLELEAKRLNHSVDLQQQSYTAYQLLYQSDTDTPACADLLGKAQNTLQDMVEIDPELQPVLELVLAALAQVEEAGREINAYGENIEADPQRLADVQQRMADLKQLCRKYGPDLANAIALRDRLQTEMLELTGGGQSIADLEAAVQATQAALTQACAHLTQLRQAAAHDLQTRLVNELKPLAMEKVQFQVKIAAVAASATGADQVTYLFSPNPGEPLQPLTEIASGGEMSRFLLALQSSFSQVDPVGTLIFDEIDTGVSGRVSQAIAEKLYQLSQHHQVLCVTHQPIIAAMADQHFRVSKQLVENGAAGNGTKPNQSADSDAVRTVVRIAPLEDDQRKQELAQLAGGQSAQEVMAFAESLLTQAQTLRQTQCTPDGDRAARPPAIEHSIEDSVSPSPSDSKPTKAKSSRAKSTEDLSRSNNGAAAKRVTESATRSKREKAKGRG